MVLMLWLSSVTLIGVLQNALAQANCPYSSYTPIYNILAADDYCQVNPVCALNNACMANYISVGNSYYSVLAIGNMTKYGETELTITNSSRTSVKDMYLPPILTSLVFDQIASLDLTGAKTTSWLNVISLRIRWCINAVVSGIKWPPNLLRLEIQGGNLVDLTNIPKQNYTLLNLFNNKLKSITNEDWRGLKFLNLGQNPLETLSNVQLSMELQFFFIKYCELKNITIDEPTAAVLNSLRQWDGTDDMRGYAIDRNIDTDPSACTAINGTIRKLFTNQNAFSVTACVLPKKMSNTVPPVTAATPNPTSSGVNIGLVMAIIAGIVVVAIIIFVLVKKNQGKKLKLLNKKTSKGDNDSELRDTVTSSQGTGSSRPHQGHISARLEIDSVEMDVTLLRPHRLELSDLVVTGNKPLASGAYGEVWLGSYGGKMVAIKRLKNRESHDVQKFIEEIVLLSQLDSDYIVKFIGASWTRPIEIECVVEFMDLGDLRSYLVNHSPQQYTWDQKYKSIVSIIRGLIYLHTYNPPIIHRDLKSRNVLLDKVKGTKITDFGTSRVALDDESKTNNIGTNLWMAPEVISGTKYSCSADIYSFGIILSEFCTHEIPYANIQHPVPGHVLTQHYLMNAVREGRISPSFDGVGVPVWVKDLAMRCLQLNEQERPTAIEVSALLSQHSPEVHL